MVCGGGRADFAVVVHNARLAPMLASIGFIFPLAISKPATDALAGHASGGDMAGFLVGIACPPSIPRPPYTPGALAFLWLVSPVRASMRVPFVDSVLVRPSFWSA